MKKHLSLLLYGAAILLAALFVLFTTMDWVHYNTALTSAPFYVTVLVNSVIFLVPAVLFAGIGLILHRRKKNKNERRG